MTANLATAKSGEGVAGQISYQFARELTGPLEQNQKRAQFLDRLMTRGDAGDALTNILVVGFRNVVDEIVRSDKDGGLDRAVERIVTAHTSDELDAHAANPAALTW